MASRRLKLHSEEMVDAKIQLVIVLCALALQSCNSNIQAVPPTSASSTATLLPATMPAITSTPLATNAPALSRALATTMPQPTPGSTAGMGTPVPSWKGLPVMPGAIEGRPAGFSYVYAITASIVEAEDYYSQQMKADGWTLANRQASETSQFGGPAVAMDFIRNSSKSKVILVFSAKDDYTMVILTMVE
jgi:hypothetical protein